jgi:crotonobetainyl-CoA:carnitine CoA-transferase CaiB-like acyl-CoA transferase
LNRNKRSVVLDLKDPDDLVVARTIAMRSDVVIENFRPGVMARAGLDHETLSSEKPSLGHSSSPPAEKLLLANSSRAW